MRECNRLNALFVCFSTLILNAAFPSQTPGLAAEAENVTAEFRVESDLDSPLVPVIIGGHQHWFVLDTGSTQTVCDKSLEPLLGARIGQARAKTPDGTITCPLFRASTLSIGELNAPATMFLVVSDLSAMRRATDDDIRGLLGMDFLAAHVVRLDYDRGKVQFLKSADGPGDPLPLLLDARRGPRIIADVHANVKIEFVVDTGYGGLTSGALRTKDFDILLRRRALSLRGNSIGASAGGSSTGRSAVLATLSLGTHTCRNLSFDESEVGNVLAFGYWMRFVATFDFPNGVVYLQRGRRFASPDPLDLSGAHLWRVNGVVRIHSVDERSPAAAAGLCAGDAVISINNTDAARTSLRALRLMLCAHGRSMTFLVKRENREREIRLVLNGSEDGS